MIFIKRGVVIANLSDDGLLEPALAAEKIWAEHAWDPVYITAGIDGNHVGGSYHYIGKAIDLRLPPDPAAACIALRDALPNWKILLETDHIHCQRTS